MHSLPPRQSRFWARCLYRPALPARLYPPGALPLPVAEDRPPFLSLRRWWCWRLVRLRPDLQLADAANNTLANLA
jgi:hypothetical protein